MLLYYGSNKTVPTPEINKTRGAKDFSWGFYCTTNEKQAERRARSHGAYGVINVYECTLHALRVKNFPEMSDEWLDFVVSCRLGGTHTFDVITGPIADDTIFNSMQNFIDGEISRTAFWKLVQPYCPIRQISFHTDAALKCLCFQRRYQIG